MGCARGGQGSGLCGGASEWNGGSRAEGGFDTIAAIIITTIIIIIIIITFFIPIITYLQASIQVKFAPPPGGGDSVGRWVEGR